MYLLEGSLSVPGFISRHGVKLATLISPGLLLSPKGGGISRDQCLWRLSVRGKGPAWQGQTNLQGHSGLGTCHLSSQKAWSDQVQGRRFISLPPHPPFPSFTVKLQPEGAMDDK